MSCCIWAFAFLALAMLATPQGCVLGDTGGAEVAVVYNVNGGVDSRSVAEHYAKCRGVPEQHLIGLSMPRSETISRAEFQGQVAEPLLRQLQELGLITLHGEILPATSERPGFVLWLPVLSKIRYLVLCYGVPLRIAHDESTVPSSAAGLPAQQRRTEASVDSELTLLPQAVRKLRLHGPYRNVLFGATNSALLHPTNGVLMVARLDGPSTQVARGLVDKAIAAENDGLWGRAYFDLRGLGDSPYKRGDEWIRTAAEVARREGFGPVVDDKASTFPILFPMPQIALYAGWYDGAPSGPFSRPAVDFMPGAFAYHLFSFSAMTLRAPSTWAAALLDKGATATIGYVFEPYLDASIDVGVFMSRWLSEGWTLGEAAMVAQPVLSWQTTVVGDPLYRLKRRSAQEWRDYLVARSSPLAEWAELRLVNLAAAGGTPTRSLIDRVRNLDSTARSAVLEEKLASLHAQNGKSAASIDALGRALALDPPPRLRTHLQLELARKLGAMKRGADSLRIYETLSQDEMNMVAKLALYQEALPVARSSGTKDLANKLEVEIARIKAAITNTASRGK